MEVKWLFSLIWEIRLRGLKSCRRQSWAASRPDLISNFLCKGETEACIQVKMVSNLLQYLDPQISGAGWILRELMGVLPEPLSIIYHQSWLTRAIPAVWESAGVVPTYRTTLQEHLGNALSLLDAGEGRYLIFNLKIFLSIHLLIVFLLVF